MSSNCCWYNYMSHGMKIALKFDKILYYIPSINFLLFCSEIVFISWGVKYFTSDDIRFFHIITAQCWYFLSELLFSIQICTKQSDSPSDIDPSWSSLEELGSFEDFTVFYVKIDNADPMLLYPDQTPAKYLHLSCILLPVNSVMALALVRISDLLSRSWFQSIFCSSQNHPHFVWQTHFSQFLGLLPFGLASNRLANG